MTTETDLRGVRRDYQSTGIRRSDLDDSPFKQLSLWLQDAVDAGAIDATAMTLATADASAHPSARIVRLKHADDSGFCWYTDSRSQKGQHMAENPSAALLFYWRDQNRQVRVTGKVEQLPIVDAEEYFHSRPEGSRFSAASSHQTAPVENREALEARVAELRAQFPAGNVPRPEAWIGYRLVPNEFEFWQGKVNRLHDRIIYRPDGDRWTMSRCSP